MRDLIRVFKMMDEGKNDEALKCALKTITELDKQQAEYLNWLNALGYIYCNLSEYSKAMDTYNQYIEIARQNKDIENLHIGFHQKAMVFRLNKQYVEALDNIMQEKEILTAYYDDDHLKLSVNAYEHGYLLYLMNHMEEAHMHMEQCLHDALKTDDCIAQACAYRGLAEICWKREEQKQANDYFDKAYALFLRAGDKLGAEEVNQMRKNKF